MKCPHCKKETGTRTSEQNKSLHLWLEMKAKQCRDAGVSPRQAFEQTMELEMSSEIMKSIWKFTQKALYKTDSTKDLSKSEQIEEIVEHLNRFFAGKSFNLEGIKFPDVHDIGGICKNKDCSTCYSVARKEDSVEYPEEDVKLEDVPF